MSRTESGVDAVSFRPSSDAFGTTAGMLMRCESCGHGSLAALPAEDDLTEAYTHAADEVSLREEPGQHATALRALDLIEGAVTPGRLVEIGSWTGSFLAAANERGWAAVGVEPSSWAAERARARGVEVIETTFDDAALDLGSFRAAVMCDVLEHLSDPHSALERIVGLLEPGGVFYLTVPDAGSGLARVLGRRWWSVLPMHLQYFTVGSMRSLLERHQLDVLEVRRHPKVFSVQYYAERVSSFVPFSGWLPRWLGRHRVGARLIGPDFRDRMAVLARRR